MKEETAIWTCGVCGVAIVSPTLPALPSDSWGYLKIDQKTDFDVYKCERGHRMPEPLLLCGTCIDNVMSYLRAIRVRELGDTGGL
jgi:hypothetical protein